MRWILISFGLLLVVLASLEMLYTSNNSPPFAWIGREMTNGSQEDTETEMIHLGDTGTEGTPGDDAGDRGPPDRNDVGCSYLTSGIVASCSIFQGDRLDIGMARSELLKAYPGADSVQRAAITKELLSRAQRTTKVVGEFFPDMTFGEEHNAFLTISRGTRGQEVVEISPSAQGLMSKTVEPMVLEATNTQTTSVIGAELVGAGFEVAPKSIVWRTIPDGMEDTFTWVVTPEREGDLQLLVVLRQKIEIGEETLNLPVNQFPKLITVSVGFWTKFGRIFSGVDTAVGTAKNIGVTVAALFGFGGLGAFYAGISAWRKRRSKASPRG